MKMASYECGVILLLLSLCWGSALHSRMYNELQNDDQTGRLRGGSHVVKEQSCPTWYRETKHNLVNKCVCGDTLRGYVMCDYATLETLIFAGFCISYNITINDKSLEDVHSTTTIPIHKLSTPLSQMILLN